MLRADKKQKTLMVLTVLAFGFLGYQIYSLVGGGSNSLAAPTLSMPQQSQAEVIAPQKAAVKAAPATAATVKPVAVHATPVAPIEDKVAAVKNLNAVAQKTLQAASNGTTFSRSAVHRPDLMKGQKVYLTLVNQFELAKMQRQLLKEQLAIAQSRQKLLALNAAMRQMPGGMASNQNPGYQLSYVAKQNGHWSATIKRGHAYKTVKVGSVLTNGQVVAAISHRGVTLRLGQQRELLNFQGMEVLPAVVVAQPVLKRAPLVVKAIVVVKAQRVVVKAKPVVKAQLVVVKAKPVVKAQRVVVKAKPVVKAQRVVVKAKPVVKAHRVVVKAKPVVKAQRVVVKAKPVVKAQLVVVKAKPVVKAQRVVVKAKPVVKVQRVVVKAKPVMLAVKKVVVVKKAVVAAVVAVTPVAVKKPVASKPVVHAVALKKTTLVVPVIVKKSPAVSVIAAKKPLVVAVVKKAPIKVLKPVVAVIKKKAPQTVIKKSAPIVHPKVALKAPLKVAVVKKVKPAVASLAQGFILKSELKTEGVGRASWPDSLLLNITSPARLVKQKALSKPALHKKVVSKKTAALATKPAKMNPNPMDVVYSTVEQKVLALPAGHYILGLVGSRHEKRVELFLTKHPTIAKKVMAVDILHNGKPWHLALLGDYAHVTAAKQAIRHLPRTVNPKKIEIFKIAQVQYDIISSHYQNL